MRIGHGPRDCERRLLAELTPLLENGLAATPVLLVVPSRSLALHLQARLVEHFGRPVLGVRCTTLWGLAVAILEDAAAPPPAVDLFALLARRHVRSQIVLADDLEPLQDGYGAPLGSVRDLLDAGLEAEHLPALEDALASPPGVSAREARRALGVARAAGATARDLAALGGGRRSDALRRAAEAVRAGAGAPCRALVVTGFADVTGVAGDLLVALLERMGGVLYLDQPPDPLDPDRVDAGAAFSERFRERLELAAVLEPAPGGSGMQTSERTMFSALGSEAEVREVARRVRLLIDGGTRPETIGIVARYLAAYVSPVRVQLGRLGIPFSGLGASGPPGPEGRRARALLELLRQRQRTPIDRWLEASAHRLLGARAHQLRGALFARGAGRLEDVAAAAERRDDAGPARPRSRRLRGPVSSAVLEVVAEVASGLCARLADWPTGTATDHSARLESLLGEALGWDEAFAPRRAIAELLSALPPRFELEFDELVELLAPTLEAWDLDPLGGAGAGVQVLDVVEARSRTFEHLFVLGLNRGVFPRLVLEDPMLPDAVRAALGGRGAGVLPDLAEKRVGFDEERFLFAQLLAASPHVTLSWQEKNDDSLPLAVSPLVARLLGSRERPVPLLAVRPPVLQPERGPWTAAEGAIVTGLGRDRRAFGAALALALADHGGQEEVRALAAARVELLDEIDPQRGTPQGERLRASLGPFFGFVGAIGAEGDPRAQQRLYVTHLERLAECPWRFFLERLLRLAPAPDPLEVLPGVEPRLVGSLVHEVLRAIVEREIGSPPATLDEARLRLGVAAAWPSETRLGRLLHDGAEAIVREEGLPLPGLARALAAAAAPILESAREREWGEGTLPAVLAAEIEGAVTVTDAAGKPRRVGFRADRVDRRGEALRLTDYKSGRALAWRERSADGRRGEMLAAVESARFLQAAAYALAGGHAEDEGRCVYVHPEVADDRPWSATARAADPGIAQAFAGAARTTLSAWDAGAFFPRFLLQDRSAEHPQCERCEVRDACVRGDSGARLRLDAWLDDHLPRPLAPAPETPAEAALVALWPLGGRE